MADLKSSVRDTISETISFVIKGKLTPIKPILFENKLDLITAKSRKTKQNCGKVVKKRNPKTQSNGKIVKNSKAKTKVQTKTATKQSAQITRKSAEKTLTTATPKRKCVNKTNCEKQKLVQKKEKNPVSSIKKPKAVKKIKVTKIKPEIKSKTDKKLEQNKINDDIKKQQTIEKLLKQASKEIKSHGPKRKMKKSQSNASVGSTSDEISLKELSIRSAEKIEQIKTEPVVIKIETSVDTPPETSRETPPRNTSKQKIKTKPKMTIIKKRVVSNSGSNSKDETRKTKLFGFWNGPKRYRVASLNALAKVHCLYENESRGNILDIMDDSAIKREYNPRRDFKKGSCKRNNKKGTTEIDEEEDSSRSNSPLPTRTLRSVPGLRAVGKHWEMHESSSSSEDSISSNESSNESCVDTIPARLEKPTRRKDEKGDESDEGKKETKRKRNRNEVMMDLKDMVVRKRMASLNATAILAASYSVEKRAAKTQRDIDDDSDSCASGSSEEYFAASDNEVKDEDDKKEEDRKLIEVHTTPNKKVAVILNQDTDVTITGVYVNSTTRSTHHEGYCSIAGMQYRISATSHTQTAATAVATETLLQSSSSSAPDNSNSDSLPSSSKSYTPLDALSNMQPPPGPGIQHNHPVLHGPPQHVLPLPPHQLSPGLRHGCSSAFSSPHANPNYQLPPGHPPMQGEPGYVHVHIAFLLLNVAISNIFVEFLWLLQIRLVVYPTHPGV
ncbi:hypothetical protein NQ317_012149 [Molorchus minor]|uniref:Uncharacterized protein n=1 Tax=Molorchus minor TaxID=1323400 RepID=A0ABQ9JNT7_9CUCU|nr:hypothetical protein NQ317_012149 [Molorchus minor]